MSLLVRGGISISIFDRRTAPLTPFSDLSDNPDTPGTTYSFQDPPQHKSANMQADPAHHPLPGLLDHHVLPATDDEMMDSDTDIRKDSDFDIEIDADEVYSNAGGADLDANYRMEEDNADNSHQLYDNDDIMLDGEDDIIFEKQQVDEADPVPDGIPTIPGASPKTLPEEQSTVPEEPSITPNIPPAISEQADQPFLPLEDPSAGEAAHLTDSQQTVSPAGESRDTLALLENTEKTVVHEAVTQDGDLQHKDNVWSENTSVTLTNEVVSLEERQANEATEQPHQSVTTVNEVEEQGAVNLANEPPGFDPHPVVVQYEQSHVSLFPPPDDVDLPFFIKDVGVCLRGMNELFSELRNVLDGSVSPGDELVIKIVDYGVEISEVSFFLHLSSYEFSLQHILDLHVRLSLQDNMENPEALRLVLFSRPSVSDRINMLLSSANEGLGYNKAIEYARRKSGDNDANSEQRFVEASEGGNLQEPEVEDYNNNDNSSVAFVHATDKPTEVEPNLTEDQGSILEQKEEFEEDDGDDDDDDDDFDLEYGNDDIANGVEGEGNEGGDNQKDEDPLHPAEAVSKDSPASINESPNYGSETPRAQENAVLELETVSDSASPRDTQTPDEVEESVSTVQGDEAHSTEEEEELIEYEDYETFGESESHHSPHTVNSESGEQNLGNNEPPPHEDLEQQQDAAGPSDTPELYEQESAVNFIDPGENAADRNHNESHSPSDGDVNVNNETSSIPVFGGDGEGEEDYVGEQQEEYGEYEYDGQQGFEAGQDASRDYIPDDEQYDIQDPLENNHESNMQRHSRPEQNDQPTDDEQNQYLDETVEYEDGYEHYDAEYDGAVNGQEALSGETEYHVGYQIYDLNQAHLRTDYGDDTVTGDANESGVAINAENDEAIDSLHSPEPAPEVESLLGYDSDDAEHNIFLEAKPSTEQKRMYDELEQDEDDDEILAKRQRSD
ncbi:hypothetical protein HOY82DRAFT_577031 [Tuber indicum]|nr:hypothetical protein HOY82DRAFT_577031 [Tuber indicum]